MKKLTLIATAAALMCASAWAEGNFEFSGYSRGATMFNYNVDQNIKGGLSLGGDLQKYRLGNEGDAGFEFNLAQTFEREGTKVKVHWMPSKWGSGAVGTNQAYVELSGLSVAPEAQFWVGQRRNRVQDVHIVDKFLLDYGDTQGMGFNGMKLGLGKLSVGAYSGDAFDAPMAAGTSANKLNVHWSDIEVNQGGTISVLLTSVQSTGLAGSNGGSGVTLRHNQANFLTTGMSNSLFLQTSTGHAATNGQFYNLSTTNAGRKVTRVADSLNWQIGAFGGQTMLGWQTNQTDGSSVTSTETSIGGRVSYASSKNMKWLFEAGTTNTSFSDGSASQSLNKLTFAPALSVGQDFWSRPELRFFVTYATWNDAAATANAASFGANGRTSQTLVGAQYEIWW
jgi:maltoporin